MILYIFLYNVIHIKCNFSNLASSTNDHKMVLIGSDYCLRELSVENRLCFEAIHQVRRDFHEINQQEVEEIVKRYLISYTPQDIRLLTNEDSTQLVCASLREKFNIPGSKYETILPFVNKAVSKKRLDNAVKTYKWLEFNKSQYRQNKEEYINSTEERLGFPMFAKPIDLVSSIETHFIADKRQLQKIAERINSHAYEFEIDEFIDGELFHCDAMIINGVVDFFMVGKCSFALARFFEGKPVGSIPIVNQMLFDELKQFCNKAFSKLTCPDGAYHMEVFLTRDKQEIVFLEIGARTGGALITRVYEKIFDINIEQVNYMIQMGLMNHVKTSKKNIYAGFLNFPKIAGIVTGIVIPPMGIEHQFFEFVKQGDILKQASNLLDISCSIIFWDDSYQKVEETFEFLKNYMPLKLTAQNINPYNSHLGLMQPMTFNVEGLRSVETSLKMLSYESNCYS